MIWVTSSEGVEADEVGVQVDLTSDESVCPKRIEREAVTEQVERAGLIGAAQEDDLAAGMERQIRLPRFREGRSWRGGFDSKSGTGAAGLDVLGGLDLEGKQRVVLEARPDLCLPAAVIALDGGLEARLARRGKDRDDPESEAESDDATDGVGILVSALEAGVVVELGIGGQADVLPVGQQRLESFPSGDEGSGPGLHQAAVEGDGVEDFDIDSAANDKAGDDVEAIQFGVPLGHLRQVPTSRRGGMPDSSTPIQGASPQQDPSDRANRRQRTEALFQQLTMDRRIAELSQGTRVFESLASGENDLFDRGGHPVGWPVRARRAITPLDAVQSLPGSPGNPSLDGRTTDMELTRDPSSAPSRPDGRNDGAAFLFDGGFLPTSLLRKFLEEILLFSKTLPKSKPSGNQAVEADGVWKAAEYGAFPHPLENAARFPQLPQPLATTTKLKKNPTKTPLAWPGVADSHVARKC